MICVRCGLATFLAGDSLAALSSAADQREADGWDLRGPLFFCPGCAKARKAAGYGRPVLVATHNLTPAQREGMLKAWEGQWGPGHVAADLASMYSEDLLHVDLAGVSASQNVITFDLNPSEFAAASRFLQSLEPPTRLAWWTSPASILRTMWRRFVSFLRAGGVS